MPIITVGDKTVEVAPSTRLVLAIKGAGVRIGHRCGGKARCTTCRVRFVAGEPETMTEAEYLKLEEKGLLGEYRLSCQVLCEHDMTVEPQMTLESEGWSDTGPQPAETVEPEARWYPKEELAAR
jgi:ferredoxin